MLSTRLSSPAIREYIYAITALTSSHFHFCVVQLAMGPYKLRRQLFKGAILYQVYRPDRWKNATKFSPSSSRCPGPTYTVP